MKFKIFFMAIAVLITLPNKSKASDNDWAVTINSGYINDTSNNTKLKMVRVGYFMNPKVILGLAYSQKKNVGIGSISGTPSNADYTLNSYSDPNGFASVYGLTLDYLFADNQGSGFFVGAELANVSYSAQMEYDVIRSNGSGAFGGSMDKELVKTVGLGIREGYSWELHKNLQLSITGNILLTQKPLAGKVRILDGDVDTNLMDFNLKADLQDLFAEIKFLF
jgi:hypothetical protein